MARATMPTTAAATAGRTAGIASALLLTVALLLAAVATSLTTTVAASVAAVADTAATAASTRHGGANSISTLQITDLNRNITIGPQIEREATSVRLKNTGRAPELQFIWTVAREDAAVQGWLAFLPAEQYRPAPDGLLADTVLEYAPLADKGDAWRYYRVMLKAPLAAGAEIDVVVLRAQLPPTTPLPKTVEQHEAVGLVYAGQRVVPSVYRSIRQHTRWEFAMASHIVDVADGLEQTDKMVSATLDNVKPLTASAMRVHYITQLPKLEVRTHTRTLTVSHLGARLNVDETYDLHNTGPALRAGYNRVESTRRGPQHPSGLLSIGLALPAGLDNVYFTDAIGHVSTSQLHREPQRTVLHLAPRYPIFGGWHFAWNVGYTVDTRTVLRRLRGDRYLVSVPFVLGLSSIPIKNAAVRIVLPQGASHIKVATAVPGLTAELSTVYSYFDTRGRPQITLRATTLIEEHQKPVQISYTLSATEAYSKAALCSAIIFGLLLVGLFFMRLDFRLTPKTAPTITTPIPVKVKAM